MTRTKNGVIRQQIARGIWWEMNVEKLVEFDVKNLGLQSNVTVNPCRRWHLLFGEIILGSRGRKYFHQQVLKFTPPTYTLVNTYSMQGIGIGNITVIHMDVVLDFKNLQSIRKDKL